MGDRISRWVKALVRCWRRIDARFNRPLSEGRSFGWQLLAPAGLTWYFPLLAAISVWGMAFGPALGSGTGAKRLFGLGVAGLALVHLLAHSGCPPLTRRLSALAHRRPFALLVRALQFPRPMLICAGYLAVLGLQVGLLTIFAAPETYAAPGLRLHIGIMMVFAMLVGLIAAAWLTTRLLRLPAEGLLAPLLAGTDLFAPRERYERSGVIFAVTAAVLALLRYPDRILMPGAVFLLWFPETARDAIGHGWIGERGILAIIFVVTWWLMTLGLLHDRLLEILETFGRLFFTGPQRVVTWIVILLGILRIMQVHYVEYLFAQGVPIFLLYTGFAYVVAWFYGFWCDTFLALRLLRLLATDAQTGAYAYTVFVDPRAPDTRAKGEGRSSMLSSVLKGGRTIALHGAGRFKIEGVHNEAYQKREGIGPRALAFLTPQQLTTALNMTAERRGSSETITRTRNVQRAAAVYPPLAAAMAYLILIIPGIFGFFYAVQPPELIIRPAPPTTPLFDLSNALAQPAETPTRSDTTAASAQNRANSACPPLAPDAPRIVLAASGGGTRAAIYTFSVLRGLAVDRRICNLIAASGVSGGSAALGYFAAHQDDLRSPDFDAKKWEDFAAAMTRAYIDDVVKELGAMRLSFGLRHWRQHACKEPPQPLETSGSWRLARTRTGTVLAEDFVCTFGPATLDELPFALLFNTALLGRFDTADPTCSDSDTSLPERVHHCAKALDASQSGGRLVLTNTAIPPASDWLVTLNAPGISIARAAALSANFPPVFSDAAIDVTANGKTGTRYWVTDGGAIENRGTIALFQALRGALATVQPTHPFPLDIVIADASGLAAPYTESRGIRSATSAGGRIGLALEEEQLADIRAMTEERGIALRVHNLKMPNTFVAAIDTHFRMPGAVVIGRNLNETTLGGLKPERMSGDQVGRLVQCLYSSDPAAHDGLEAEPARKALQIAALETGPWQNGAAWRQMQRDLGVTPLGGMCAGLGPAPP